jgi:NTP pyrophosphatase (non-canonical NTP hydrolase)
MNQTPPTSENTSLATLQGWVDAFSHKRQWETYHTPKNLAMSIAIEAGELMEHVQWWDQAEDIQGISEEMADVLAYLLRLASVLEIDLAAALKAKMEKNAIKYPLGHADPRPPKKSAPPSREA